MKLHALRFLFLPLLLTFVSLQCKPDDPVSEPDPIPNPTDTTKKVLNIISLTTAEGTNLLGSGRILDVARDFEVTARFNHPVDVSTITENSVRLARAGFSGNLDISFSDSNKTVVLRLNETLDHLQRYTLYFTSSVKGEDGGPFDGLQKQFYTELDPTPKQPVISDEQLLSRVQEQTFKYFWDFGHPVSGLARERNTSGEVVTIGGSGFGVMAILVGIERGFITRSQGIDRLTTIVDFLTAADRFHGAWPHWMNGTTGKTIPFSADDNGADLVETAFMIEGLLTVREYLDPGVSAENNLIAKIDSLWYDVEWDWFTKGGENVLYWHWSPDKGWVMNHQIRGWNEALIVYFLAAASPTHPINASVYHNGWASSGGMQNGNDYYNITLPLGSPRGGPLFFAHYSFLGLNPTNLTDQYANYWDQNRAHSLINQAYCVANPQNYVGYSADCWGLTASDGNSGYSAHSPGNDRGVITPTAALSSFPYTPDESMDALKFFYYTIGDRTWGSYGFYDAFNLTEGWFANSYLAIDQGPIIIMIENHRTGLLWNNFMNAPEVAVAMTKLGFTN
ncbi:MAG: glucoamylase family protein [Owenweeksia sp.]